MTNRARAGWVALAVAMVVSVAVAQAVKDSKESVHVTPDNAKFVELVPGVERATLWGDPDVGPYGAYTRFKPGLKVPTHTHSNDIRIVVLEGAYIFITEAGEKRIGPREYLFIPANVPHATSTDAEKGALMYDESPGKFDMIEKK